MDQRPSITIAATHDRYFELAEKSASAAGCRTSRISTDALLDLVEFPNLLIIASDDIAMVREAVEHVHQLDRASYGTPVVVLTSKRSIRANPWLQAWLIDGAAAVQTVLSVDDRDTPRYLPILLRRITS
jgi:hypothetical protein